MHGHADRIRRGWSQQVASKPASLLPDIPPFQAAQFMSLGASRAALNADIFMKLPTLRRPIRFLRRHLRERGT